MSPDPQWLLAAPEAVASGSAAVLVPVKAFHDAKRRLSSELSTEERATLARTLAEGVVAAAAPLPCAVACDSEEVALWAQDLDLILLEMPPSDLNEAVSEGLRRLWAMGAGEVVVASGDLPGARDLSRLTGFAGVTIVPDRGEQGTNVLCLPRNSTLQVSYGPGSFRRHLRLAALAGTPARVLRMPELMLDIDLPEDLRDAVLAKRDSGLSPPSN